MKEKMEIKYIYLYIIILFFIELFHKENVKSLFVNIILIKTKINYCLIKYIE